MPYKDPRFGGRYLAIVLQAEACSTRSVQSVDQLVDHLFRQEFGRMVSRLARILGAPRLAMAEDAVQYAMLQALQLWPYQGVPEYPQAWLAKVAYHRALDILKSERKLRFYDDEKEFNIRKQIEELQDEKPD